jgi:myo-inositol-1(or 4)-monophosphatase
MGYQQENAELLALCVRAAAAGAAVIRAAAPGVRSLDWRAKGPTDFVSEVDLAAEAAILGVMTAELSEATVFAEESAASVPRERLERGLALVVDPLDGTTNFLHGFPEYAVSIAVLRDGEPVAAVVQNVPRGEVFTAAAGAGCAMNGSPCRVSTISDPQRALFGTGFPFKTAQDIAPYNRQLAVVMASAAGIRRPGAAALDLASVACGRFDGFWEFELNAWDFAAGMLLVREAGGLATDFSGAHLKAFGPSSVLAGNPAMHAWLTQALGRA